MKNLLLIVMFISITAFTSVMEAQTLRNIQIKGSILNSSKRPAASLWVILSQNSKKVGQSLTGDDGKYYIGNLAKGNYDLEVKQGGKSLFQKQITLPRDTINNIQLR